jgi:ankyrin repeat protein
MIDEEYHVTALSHYCGICQNVTGHAKMSMLQDAINAATEIENFASLDLIENFPKHWHGVLGHTPDIASTANRVWTLVQSLEKQVSMDTLKGLLDKVDHLNSTQGMLDNLYESRTSNVPKTPGFSLVSTEAWHVTISNQAHSLRRIVDKTFFVSGSLKIERARHLINFFSVENLSLCPELRHMPDVVFKLRTGEVGQQMIGLILATQAALKSGPYEKLKNAVVAERKLLTEMRFPIILSMHNECRVQMPLMSTDALSRAADLVQHEKELAEEHMRGFAGSPYSLLVRLVKATEGISQSPVCDAARRKIKIIDELEKTRDYLVMRDLIVHVDMIRQSEIVDNCVRIVGLVREMISTKEVGQLRAIISQLSRLPACNGIPDLERIKKLLALEATLDHLDDDAQIQAVLDNVSDRLAASARMDKARQRLATIEKLCATHKVNDIFSAAASGEISLIKHFFQLGAQVHDKNKAGETALLQACASGQLLATEYLLASGARLSDTADNGYNCLHFAVCAGHMSVVEDLVTRFKDARLSINAMVSPLQCTALHLAAKHGRSEVAGYLLENRATAEAGDANGNTPLLCALGSCQPETAAFLIEYGCDTKASNSDNYNALHFAAKNGYLSAAKRCVEDGLSLNASTRAGLTALHLAAANSQVDMCFWLLYRASTDINEFDHRGCTPLHHAAAAGHIQLVQLLLSYGANPHLENSVARGYRAIDVAQNEQVAALLSEHMTTPETHGRLTWEKRLNCVVHTCEEICDARRRANKVTM